MQLRLLTSSDLRDQLKNKLTESLNIAEEINIREKTWNPGERSNFGLPNNYRPGEKNKPAAWKKK